MSGDRQMTTLPVTSRWGGDGHGTAYIFAPWLAALPEDHAELLALLPVVGVNETLEMALARPGGPAERRALAVAAFLAVDPFLRVRDFAARLHDSGVTAVANFPTTQLIDGDTARAFEASAAGFTRELAVMRALALHGITLTAFCIGLEQALALRDAGASTLVLHPGPRLRDWRRRAAGALRLARAIAALRGETGSGRVPRILVYRPTGYGAELDAALAAADGEVRLRSGQSSSP